MKKVECVVCVCVCVCVCEEVCMRVLLHKEWLKEREESNVRRED